jgi:hypothetical protein
MMKNFIPILLLLLACSNDNINGDGEIKNSKAEKLIEQRDSVFLYMKNNYSSINKIQIENLTGQWKFDSILEKNEYFPIGQSCILFHDWGGFAEGYCKDTTDLYNIISPNLLYKISFDTLEIHHNVSKGKGTEIPILTAKTLKSKYLIIDVDSFSLVLYDIKKKNIRFHSRYDLN